MNARRLAQINAPKQRPEKFQHTVQTVRACRVKGEGTKFEVMGEFHVNGRADAMDSADRLQEEFDNDGDPCRTYVYKDGDPAPVYAGLQYNPKQKR